MRKSNLLKDQASSLSVLCVDDDEISRKILQTFLNKYFLVVDFAIDGEDGYQKYMDFFQENYRNYDFVISDLHMPRMDGVQMSRKIRHVCPTQSIILSSSDFTSTHLLALINLKINLFLVKPLVYDDLIDIFFKLTQERNDHLLLKHYYQEIEELSNTLAEKNRQLERTVRFYKEEIEILKIANPSVELEACVLLEQEAKEPRKTDDIDVLKKDLRSSFDEKIDAKTFVANLDDSIMDKIESMTHELDRLAMVIYDFEDDKEGKEDAFYLEEIIYILNNYGDTVHNLATFPIIVRAFLSFTQFLSGVSDAIKEDDEKKKLFIMMTLGLVKDLESWVKNIFILQETKDIHYFDASFTNSCYDIESMFTQNTAEIHNDIEFF